MKVFCNSIYCPYNKKGLYCDKIIVTIDNNGLCSELTMRQEYIKQEMQNGFRSEFKENKRSDREDAGAVNECDSAERNSQEADD